VPRSERSQDDRAQLARLRRNPRRILEHPARPTVRPGRYPAAVPRISAFYGVVIYMYIRDHGPPHLHAWAADQRAVVDIRTGSVTRGRLRTRQAALVRDWVELHREELLEAWGRASRGDAPGTIEPLP
jgi:Domain of unknown function (DUF4160)